MLPTPRMPSIKSWRRQFLLNICPIQMDFLLKMLVESVLFSPTHFKTSSTVSFFVDFIFSTLLHHIPSKAYFFPDFLQYNTLNQLFIYKSQSRDHIISASAWFPTCMICSLMVDLLPICVEVMERGITLTICALFPIYSINFSQNLLVMFFFQVLILVCIPNTYDMRTLHSLCHFISGAGHFFFC